MSHVSSCKPKLNAPSMREISQSFTFSANIHNPTSLYRWITHTEDRQWPYRELHGPARGRTHTQAFIVTEGTGTGTHYPEYTSPPDPHRDGRTPRYAIESLPVPFHSPSIVEVDRVLVFHLVHLTLRDNGPDECSNKEAVQDPLSAWTFFLDRICTIFKGVMLGLGDASHVCDERTCGVV